MQQQKAVGDQVDLINDKCRGVLWGAVLGDVIGAYLEFSSDFSKQKINRAFTICGGGQHKLEPGQPTDDSELSYALGKGLSRGNGTMNLNFIAEQMSNWFLSKPIDVGGTIRKSVPKACNMKEHQAHLCRKGAKENSQASQSNGTLMAISPLGIWVHKLQPAQIIEAVRQYTILIHPNECVILANTLFILMVSYLLNHSEQQRNANAYEFAKKTLEPYMSKEFKEWVDLIDGIVKGDATLEKDLPANKKAGWVRVALTYSIYHLLKGKSYKKSIQQIIQAKGDTDTNACIAGGIMGAHFGFQKIQMEKQIQVISQWRPKKVKRPDWMVPGLVVQKLVTKLIAIAPTKLTIIGSSKEYQNKKQH